MKRNNKKGFTIVELVIVIAVIAILAAVLIPTFSGVIEKANKSARLQKARNAYTEYYAQMTAEELASEVDLVIKVDEKTFYIVDDNEFSDVEYATEDLAKAALKNGEAAYTWGEAAGNGKLDAVSGKFNQCDIKKASLVPASN